MGKKPIIFFTELYLKYYNLHNNNDIALKKKQTQKTTQKTPTPEVVINNISVCYAFIC